MTWNERIFVEYYILIVNLAYWKIYSPQAHRLSINIQGDFSSVYSHRRSMGLRPIIVKSKHGQGFCISLFDREDDCTNRLRILQTHLYLKTIRYCVVLKHWLFENECTQCILLFRGVVMDPLYDLFVRFVGLVSHTPAKHVRRRIHWLVNHS